jgi:hypothetical protein
MTAALPRPRQHGDTVERSRRGGIVGEEEQGAGARVEHGSVVVQDIWHVRSGTCDRPKPNEGMNGAAVTSPKKQGASRQQTARLASRAQTRSSFTEGSGGSEGTGLFDMPANRGLLG